MRRREFIAGFVSVLTVWSKSSVAQQTGEMPTVAVVGVEPEPKAIAAFEQGMRTAGWVKDINVRLDYYFGRSDPTPVLTEIVNSKPTMIATWGTPNTRAAHTLTARIPIVFAVVSDPVGQGIVENLAHPGGNITGFSHFDAGMGSKWLELLHEIVPQTTRVASMFNPAFGTYIYEHAIEEAAHSLDLEVMPAPVLTDRDIEAVFERLTGEANIALLLSSDAFTYVRSEMIADLAAKHRIPAILPARRFVDAGGLISYGPDLFHGRTVPTGAACPPHLPAAGPHRFLIRKEPGRDQSWNVAYRHPLHIGPFVRGFSLSWLRKPVIDPP